MYFDVKFSLDLKKELSKNDYNEIDYNELLEISLTNVQLTPISFGVRVRMKDNKATSVTINSKKPQKTNLILEKYNIVYLNDIKFERKINIEKNSENEISDFFVNYRIGFIWSTFVILGIGLEIFWSTRSSSQGKLGPGMNLWKYFQITDVLLNISKFPIDFDQKIVNLFSIIDSLRMPSFKNPLNIFNDEEEYKYFRKGERQIDGNSVFFLNETNLFLAPSLIIISICFYFGYFFGNKKNKFIKILGKIKTMLFEITIVKFSTIALFQTESEYENRDRPITLKLSFYFSYIYISILVFELIWSFKALGIKRTKGEIEKLDLHTLDKVDIETSEIVEEFKMNRSRVLFYQKVKFLTVQLVIVMLPTLPVAQLGMNIVIQLGYSFHLTWLVVKLKSLQKNGKIKKKIGNEKKNDIFPIFCFFQIAVEEIIFSLTLIILTVIFASKESKILNLVLIFSISTFLLSELIFALISMIKTIAYTLKKENRKKIKKDKISVENSQSTTEKKSGITLNKIHHSEEKIRENIIDESLENRFKEIGFPKINFPIYNKIRRVDNETSHKDDEFYNNLSPKMIKSKTEKNSKFEVFEPCEKSYKFKPIKIEKEDKKMKNKLKKKIKIFDNPYDVIKKKIEFFSPESKKKIGFDDLKKFDEPEEETTLKKLKNTEDEFQTPTEYSKKKKIEMFEKEENKHIVRNLQFEFEKVEKEIEPSNTNRKIFSFCSSNRKKIQFGGTSEDSSNSNLFCIASRRRTNNRRIKPNCSDLSSSEDDSNEGELSATIVPDKLSSTRSTFNVPKSFRKNIKTTSLQCHLNFVIKSGDDEDDGDYTSRENRNFNIEGLNLKKRDGEVTIRMPARRKSKSKVFNDGEGYADIVDEMLQDQILEELGVDVQKGNCLHESVVKKSRKINVVSKIE